MNKSHRTFSQGSKVIAIGMLGLMLNACNSDHHHHHQHKKGDVAGYVYTSTNGNGDDGTQGENEVLRLTRYTNGTLGNEKVFSTDGMGASDVSAGGDARGDFDSQDAMKIIGDYMLVVNAGSDNVSVFKINKENGDLNLIEEVQSGGTKPVSIAVTKNANVDGNYWVVIGNQWNNPNVQGPKDSPICYPQPTTDADSYFDSNCQLNDPTATDDGRNIALFQFDSSNGSLTMANSGKPLESYDRQTGGPADVVFSDDGTKLAVSTWGIAHIADEPSDTLQQPSRVYVYDFNNTTGAVSNSRVFQKKGIAATVGINWAKGNNSVIHASNANLDQALKQLGYGLTVLRDVADQVVLEENFDTGNPDVNDAACWTLLSPSGDRVYVASFKTNEITPFKLQPNGDGTVETALASEARPVSSDPNDINKNPDFKDMYISSDNQYLYVLGAFNTYTVNRFAITADGLKYVDQYIFHHTKDARGDAGQHNFLGFVGFDIAKN